MNDRQYHRQYSKAYYHKRRAQAVALLGGECVDCRSTDDLEFDHVDRSSKSFAIAKLLNYAWARVLEELKKCVLRCHACHLAKSKHGKELGLAGSKHPSAKLTDEKVREIRNSLADGDSERSVAKEFGVSRRTISDIKMSRTWKHVDRWASG